MVGSKLTLRGYRRLSFLRNVLFVNVVGAAAYDVLWWGTLAFAGVAAVDLVLDLLMQGVIHEQR